MLKCLEALSRIGSSFSSKALAAAEVHDPAYGQQHFQDDHHQEPHDGGERTSPGVVSRLAVEPGRVEFEELAGPR